jgi:hypothetical protein
MSLGTHLRDFSRQHGVQRTCEFFSQARKEKKIAADQIHLRDLAEAFGGPQWHVTLRPGARVRESGGAHASAIDPSAFASIGGQLLIDEVGEGYESADRTLGQLIDERPITNGNLGDQIIHRFAGVEDTPDEIQPGMPYPHTRPGLITYTVRGPKKYGLKSLVTMEAIFANQTLDIMEGMRDVGEAVQVWEEQAKADVVAGVVNPYVRNGTAYNTYLTTGAWINKKSGVTVSDWNQLNELEQLFGEMRDPTTGRSVKIRATAIIAMPYRVRNVQRAISATTIYTGNYPETGVGTTAISDNPMKNAWPVYESRYIYDALIASGVSAANAREYVYAGDWKKAFVWRYARKFWTEELPPDSLLSWNQDIVFGVKAGTWGSANVKDPLQAALLINA